MIDLQNPKCIKRGWGPFTLPIRHQHQEEFELHFWVKVFIRDSWSHTEAPFVLVDGRVITASICRHCRQPYMTCWPLIRDQVHFAMVKEVVQMWPEILCTIDEARERLAAGFAEWRRQNHQHEGPQDDCWVCNTDMFDLVAPAYIFGQDKVR